ncbi:MAG: YraN family protein [Ruminococcaceae bacterium]|nr:YraN family protein [Oscillospiraceae bacterium]
MFFGNTSRDIGRKGEKLAADYLKKHGYKIVAKNFSSAHGEIDLVVTNKDFLVFVEVKSRKDNEENFKNYGFPAEAVNKTKQRHIIFTANVFLQKHPTDKALRFDVVEVYLGKEIRINHIEDAFVL